MRAARDPDLVLIGRMLAPPPLDDARSSLEYWQQRRKILPLYRLAARREARAMAVRWQERVRAAQRVRFETSVQGRVLAALGISGLWVRVRYRRRGPLSMAWAFVPRKVKLVAGTLAAAWLILLVGAVAAFVLVLGQLA